VGSKWNTQPSTFVCSSCVAVLADQYEGGQENRLDGASITRITKEGWNFGATGKAPTLTARLCRVQMQIDELHAAGERGDGFCQALLTGCGSGFSAGAAAAMR
jgi:hypothetical protein